MEEFHTVKRKALVGERILITHAQFMETRYDDGDILTVTDSDSYGVYSEDALILEDEYEVIIGEESA
ncbi:Uncharacterised protein [Niallia circulans]|uniref:hypothetical protein n=1 Tax=Niallia circulans TaxID=1397 RepID=UPI00077C52EA|nr:hypothetical protein [Niallia circulans]MDR4318730.1 hypothetical protein [Niallia circulans]MED3839307.1 hypothetical protein [Niallia circulans]MED4245289.1 hypothetical protein [Niallia circulans]MED4250825.1 hypothetical protein [Niallia circulans]QKH60109.1 hypothetical protein FOC77_05295 [Niallia circulans]